jgi:hypothetical protein
MSEFTAFPDKTMTDPIENALPRTEMLSLLKLQRESLRQGEAADFWRGILTSSEPPSVVLSVSTLRRIGLAQRVYPSIT